MTGSVREIDIHEMSCQQAKTYIDSELKKSNRNLYVLRVVHGFHSGTKLRDMVRKSYRNHPKVIRIELGMNQGVTDLILRELF